MNMNEQISRVESMEKRYDRIRKSVCTLEKALSNYAHLRPELKELIRYYDSGLWRRDYEDDNAGRIPETLKRGVLSEDAIFDLLTDIAELKSAMAPLLTDE